MLRTIDKAVDTAAPQPSARYQNPRRIGRNRSSATKATTHTAKVGSASSAERRIALRFSPGTSPPPSVGVGVTDVTYIHPRQAANSAVAPRKTHNQGLRRILTAQ